MPDKEIMRLHKFSAIMHELGVDDQDKACMYLAFAVHVQIREENAEVDLASLYKRVATRHNVSKEHVEKEILSLEIKVYENLTGVQALVNTKASEITEKYFRGNVALIQEPKQFLTCIINALRG